MEDFSSDDDNCFKTTVKRFKADETITRTMEINSRSSDEEEEKEAIQSESNNFSFPNESLLKDLSYENPSVSISQFMDGFLGLTNELGPAIKFSDGSLGLTPLKIVLHKNVTKGPKLFKSKFVLNKKKIHLHPHFLVGSVGQLSLFAIFPNLQGKNSEEDDEEEEKTNGTKKGITQNFYLEWIWKY